ncbi:MAG: 3-oxoacyl-[acyl-carrier-protein] reductase [Actinobacteria bacterium]|nr:3-oxoacyl-[acyl-carrier-protein] reductase [Actinomycetota bacterium]
MNQDTKVALITGGNRGIGLAIAEKFKQDGYQVIVTHRSGSAPQGLDGVIMDVTDSDSVNNAVKTIEEKYGRIDVLVANAGITKDGLVMRMSDEDFESVVETNLMGAFRVARACTRGMLKQKSGRIIFVGSVVGMLGSAGQVNYAATKSGLIGMARSFARELGSRGITANVVAPGFVETEMTQVLDEKRKAEIIGAVPLARFATPNEVAGVVAFLASPEAAYITGAVIPIDGGLGMGH